MTKIQSSTANGTLVSYEYDKLNRLTNAVDSRLSGTQNTRYGYDPVVNLLTNILPNSVTNLYRYDALNRLTNLTAKAGVTTLGSFAYSLGPTGNRTNLGETVNGVVRTNAWTYDALYRLTNEVITSTGTISYKYDDVGNRTNRASSVSGISNVAYTNNANDELATDAYDANGNTTNSAGNPYRYDFENRLTNYKNRSAVIVYDGDGNRVSKEVGETTTLYLVDTRNPSSYAQVLEELTTVSGGATNLSRACTYGLNLISQRQPGVSTNFFVYDGHGSTRLLTDGGTNVVNAFAYDAYGTLIASNTASQTAYLYCAQQYDFDLGLSYNRTRYLSTGTGRFWTRDTFEGGQEDPLSLHKYLYAEGNPISNRDPSGHDIGDELAIIDIDSTLDGLSFPALAVGTASGMGGPDVTKTLSTTLLEVQMAFWSWTPWQKSIAANQLTSLPYPGHSGASGGLVWAWDIVPLKDVGFKTVNLIPSGNGYLDCGTPPWAYTVAVNSKCFYAGSVNYAEWGVMFKSIHEYYESIGDPMDAGAYTLTWAQRFASLWKSHYGDAGETAREATDFTAYGYNGTFPSMGLSCRPSSKVCQSRDFEWVWEPYKPRAGGRD